MCFGELCLHAVGNDYEMRRKKLAGIIGILVFLRATTLLWLLQNIVRAYTPQDK